MERTNIFLSSEEKNFFVEVAEKNEQSLSWILRKVLSNYFDYCNANKIKNGSTKEVNKTLSVLTYQEVLADAAVNSENVIQDKPVDQIKVDLIEDKSEMPNVDIVIPPLKDGEEMDWSKGV